MKTKYFVFVFSCALIFFSVVAIAPSKHVGATEKFKISVEWKPRPGPSAESWVRNKGGHGSGSRGNDGGKGERFKGGKHKETEHDGGGGGGKMKK